MGPSHSTAGNIPATLVGSDASRADGFPDRVTYRFNLPEAATFRVNVDSSADRGGGLEARWMDSLSPPTIGLVDTEHPSPKF